MLAYVPVRFDLYRPLKPHLRWTLQCLVGFADHAGKCFPGLRTLATVIGIGKSSVSRHLAELSHQGVISRTRKPGGVYVYTIDSRYLPATAKAAPELSHRRDRAVPPVGAKENLIKKTADFYDDSGQWEVRVRSWRQSGGKFWLPLWGPKPNERGCFAPPSVLLAAITAPA